MWNVLDVVIIVISYVCIIFNVYRQLKVAEILDELLTSQEKFADFEFLAYWQTQFNNVVAFVVFLAWIKVGCLSVSAVESNAHLDLQIRLVQQNDDSTLVDIVTLRQRCSRLQCHVHDRLSGLCSIGLPLVRHHGRRLQIILHLDVSQPMESIVDTVTSSPTFSFTLFRIILGDFDFNGRNEAKLGHCSHRPF